MGTRSRGKLDFVAAAARAANGSVTVEQAFERLSDFASWASWMPRSFRPVSGPSGRPLAVGDRLKVRIARGPLPTSIVVSEIDPGRAIAWKGGVPGVLTAVHRFVFDAAANEVRSIETWSGALAPVARFVVKPAAERIGRDQLAGLLS